MIGKSATIDELTILRTLDDANEVVLGERADKRNLDAQHIGNGLNGMQLCLVSLGSVLSGTSDSKPTS